MKSTGIMRRLMIFVDETDRLKDKQLATAIVERLRELGCAGATMLHGMSGYGTHKQIHTTALLDLSISLPIVIIAIDTAEKMATVQPVLEEMIQEGIIVADDVEVTKLSKGK